MMDDFLRFAAELDKMPAKVVREGRGMTARKVDAAARDAQQKALATWTTYGRGMGGSAGTIRARMSANRGMIRGYILADGDGAFYQEHGTGHHPPQPVMRSALEGQVGGWVSELGKIAGEW
jgi:HK97 gp10 family phage protein